MKLLYFDEKKEPKYLDIGFWSMFKFFLISWAILFVLLFLIGLSYGYLIA